MKLGTLKSSSRDGELVLVSKDNQRAVKPIAMASTLQEVLDNWDEVYPSLLSLWKDLNDDKCPSAIPVKEKDFHSPLPRAYQWVDGSAFLHHVKLVRMARNAEMPEKLYSVPLMYQGGSDSFLAPYEDIPQIDFQHGTDFEAEFGVVTGDVPMGVTPEEALKKIRLVVMINDVSLRGLIPDELAMGFGFFQSKPSSAIAPFAVTPDELGEAWKDGRVHLPLHVEYNREFFGQANGKEMHFSFGQLIAHAARTRPLAAGTIIGSGTVSNEDPKAGSSCLAEKRMIEKIEGGEIKTPFMKVGDHIKMWVADPSNHNIFGTIEQKVIQK